MGPRGGPYFAPMFFLVTKLETVPWSATPSHSTERKACCGILSGSHFCFASSLSFCYCEWAIHNSIHLDHCKWILTQGQFGGSRFWNIDSSQYQQGDLGKILKAGVGNGCTVSTGNKLSSLILRSEKGKKKNWQHSYETLNCRLLCFGQKSTPNSLPAMGF